MRRRALVTALALVAAAVALQTLASGTVGESPRSGGTLRLALYEDPGGFDVQRDTTHLLYNRARELFNTLLRYSDDGHELEPELLARMPRVSPDGRVYEFELRRGVRFHDGSELTAQDVRFSLERILSPATLSPHAGFLVSIEGAPEMLAGRARSLRGLTVEGRYRFRVTLREPYAPFLHLLALPAFSIYPEHAVRQAGPAWPLRPVGTGPFRLAAYEPDRRILLVRNQAYFEPGFPRLDAIEYRVLPDSATAMLEFQAGHLDIIRLPDPEFPLLVRHPAWRDRLLMGPSFNTYYLLFNVSRPPLRDPRVRKAIAMAVDVDALVRHLLEGRATRAYGIVPPGILGAQRLPVYPYDPPQARRLLAEAGYPEGFTLEVPAPPGGMLFHWYEALQGMLREVGIHLRLRPTDRATFYSTRAAGGVPLYIGNWWAEFADPDNFLFPLFHSSQSGYYSCAYRNPRVDRLLEAARRAAGPAERARLYREAERLVVLEDVAAVPLWHLRQSAVVQPWVKGYAHHPTGLAANSHKQVWLGPR